MIALASAGIAADPVTPCRQVKDVLAIVPATSAGSHEPFHLPVGQRQLFLDDYLIADVRDVTPKLHQPVKFGAVIRPDKPWEGNSIQVRTGPSFRQDGLWMLWYLNGYATSKDGEHWEKPELGIREFNGSRDNNLMLPFTEYRFKDDAGKELLSQKGDGITVDNVFLDSHDPTRCAATRAWDTKGRSAV